MAKTRTQKAALNTVTGLISEVVQLICTFALSRLVLAHFGSAYNGITMSVKQLLSTIYIFTVGVSGATRVALYKSLAAKDDHQTSRIVKATQKYMHKVGFILLGMIVLLTIFYPMVVDTGYSWIEVAPLIIAAGVSATARYYFGVPYLALLVADQSAYVYNIFFSVANVLNVIVSLILIRLGFNVQVVKLVSSFVLAMNPILRAVYVHRKYKLERHCEPDNSALSMRKDTMAHSIANIVHDNTDMIVLTIFCNVKIVSVYTVYNLVLSALKRMQRVFTSGTEAVYGDMWVKKEYDKIRVNLGYYEYIIAMFSSIVFPTTMVMILPFISLYTKNVHDVEYILPVYALVIVLAHLFFCFRTPYMLLVQGVGQYKETKKGAYAEAAINLILSVVLVQFMGIVGVAIGTLAANLFRTVQYAVYIDNHIVKRGKMVFIARILWALGNSAAIYFASNRLVEKFAYNGWMNWVITAVIVTAFSTALSLLSSLIFYRSDLKGCTNMLKRVVKRRGRRKA